MTYTELQEKIAHLEAELAEVKEMAEAMKKRADGGLFKPENRERYWYISREGDVAKDLWNDHPFDHKRYAIGNCFPTKQSAEDTVRVLKLIQKARESQDGFVPDWENLEQDKYLFYFHHGNIGVSSLPTMNTAPTFGYWRDKSSCEQFIIANHDELIWFFTEYHR